MSEIETTGRCRSEMEKACGTSSSIARVDLVLADAIDRLAADVAAIKEAVCDGSVAEERDRFLAGMCSAIKERDAAIRERDEARAEVEKLKAMRRWAAASTPQPAAPPAGWLTEEERRLIERIKEAVRGNSSKTSNSSPVAPQPAAPQKGWLTDRERHVLSSLLSERPCDWSLHWADDVQPVFRSILSRAGSPPVVEVPVISRRDVPMQNEAFAYRDAMDRAGVAWKEVGRE